MQVLTDDVSRAIQFPSSGLCAPQPCPSFCTPKKGIPPPSNIANLDFQKPLGEASAAVAPMAQPNAEPLEDYE